MSPPQVIFFTVNDTHSKLLKIAELCHRHFEKKEHLQIVLPDQQSLDFLDALLWRLPLSSFLPHTINPGDEELILLSLSAFKWEKSHLLFNLTGQAYLERSDLKEIYELDDRTSDQKKQQSLARFKAYQGSGYFLATA